MIDFRAKFGDIFYDFIFTDLDLLIVRGLGTYKVNPEEFNRCFSLGRELSLKEFLSRSILLEMEIENHIGTIIEDGYFVEIESSSPSDPRFLSMKVQNENLITRDDLRKFGIKKVLDSSQSYNTRSVNLFNSWTSTLTKKEGLPDIITLSIKDVGSFVLVYNVDFGLFIPREYYGPKDLTSLVSFIENNYNGVPFKQFIG